MKWQTKILKEDLSFSWWEWLPMWTHLCLNYSTNHLEILNSCRNKVKFSCYVRLYDISRLKFCILHRIISTLNKCICSLNTSDTENCKFYRNEIETIQHIFFFIAMLHLCTLELFARFYHRKHLTKPSGHIRSLSENCL